MPDREKVIEALRICRESLGTKNCRKCPYMRGRDGTGTCYPIDAEENGVHLCWQDLVDDAIALLKEREPRVMTLDEVLTADDFVWAEIYTPSKWSWCAIYVKIIPVVSNDEIVRIEEDCGTGWTKSKSDYGKRGFLDGGWRCWTARPTEEQMRDTKWEETDV